MVVRPDSRHPRIPDLPMYPGTYLTSALAKVSGSSVFDDENVTLLLREGQ